MESRQYARVVTLQQTEVLPLQGTLEGLQRLSAIMLPAGIAETAVARRRTESISTAVSDLCRRECVGGRLVEISDLIFSKTSHT